MKINELVKIGERTEQRVVYHDAEYDEEGNLTAEAWDEIIDVQVPVMGMVYRDMTDEEIAEIEQINATPLIEEPSQLDRIEAQTMYTALMTDTLIEEE